jgi:hypothetical protein
MLNQISKERMAAEEAARFMEGGFGQLDLSGFPDLTHPQTETFELQDRHGFNRVDESGLAGINQLKELLAHPPREVVEELARETGNPKLISELADERAEEVVHEFRRRNPDYLRSDSNWRCIVETMAHNLLGEDDMDPNEAQDLLIENGHWTLTNLEAAYKALDRVGALEYPANQSRPLTEAQRLRAEQLAANGDVLGGIVEYVKGRISEDAADQVAFTLADPLAFTTDPAMRPILEEACWFCWEAYRKDYSPSTERRQFLQDYCGGRFVTVALLDAAWEECKVAERDVMRSSLIRQVSNERAETPAASPSSLDRLDDVGIDNLYHSTLREYARSVKRQHGVIV